MARHGGGATLDAGRGKVATFETSLVIARPLAATFAFLTDFRNAPRWDPRTYDARKLTPGHIGLGTRFLLAGGLISRATLDRLHLPDWLRQTTELPYEVVSFVPRREMVVRGQTSALRYEDHLVFSADGDATRLQYFATMELTGVFHLAEPLLGRLLETIGSDATRGMPAAVEAAVALPAPAPAPTWPISPIVHPDDVRRVAGLDDQAFLRNLFITQGYHDLSQAILARTGGTDMNWCTLGAWASKTAGTFIRDEEVPAAFRALLRDAPSVRPATDALERTMSLGADAPAFSLIEIARAVLHDCSTYITVGNKIVYAELAQCCADFMHALGSDTVPDPARLAAFQASFTDGPPEPDEVEWGPHRTLLPRPRGGQALLRDMVGHLYRAMFETDPKRRAERLLFANAAGGLHEQTRLQTYIAGGIDAPIADTLLAWAHRHVDRHAAQVHREQLHGAVDARLPTLARIIEKAWHAFATDLLMTLTLPDGVLHLGRSIPHDDNAPLLPPALATIDDPELAALLDRHGALHVRVDHSAFGWLQARIRALLGHPTLAAGELADAGALDWTDLAQRMRFILTLFRVRQQDPDLFRQPFTDAQRAAIFAGRLP
jgi:hypothetical protein